MDQEFREFGSSGIVTGIKDSAFKTPFHETLKDVEFERSAYEKLGRHPRVAECRGTDQESLVFRFYSEGNVDRKISKAEFKIPLIKWADQIAESLIFIHDHGVIHGDPRCANILVTDELDLVLADFGSAAIDGVKGTLVSYDTRHCAPNFHDSGHQVTCQDDLFAFATVLYHLSTRKLPYNDRAKADIAYLYRNGNFPDVSGLQTGNIINKCWRRGYTSAAEVQMDIRQLQSFPTHSNIWSCHIPSAFAIPLTIVFGFGALLIFRIGTLNIQDVMRRHYPK